MKGNVLLFLMVLMSWSGLSLGQTPSSLINVTSQVQVSKSGFVLNRSTNTFNTTLTLTNAVQPLYMALTISVTGLPSGVTLNNATGTDNNGNPTIQISLPQGTLGIGEKISNVLLKFNNPRKINFSYSTQFFGTLILAGAPEIVLLAPASTTSLTLAWLPASLNNIPANQLNYAIYVSTTNNFTANASTLYTSVIGNAQTTLTGLNAATTYYVLIIAKDQQGDEIAATKYASASTFNAPLVFNPAVPLNASDALGLGLYTQNGDNFTFNKNPGTQIPPANSVLVAHGSDGYQLLTVNNVAVSGSQINLTTSPASLSDVLDQATVSSNMLLFDVSSTSTSTSATANVIKAQSATQLNGNRNSQINWGNKLLSAVQTDHAYQDNQLAVTPQSKAGQYAISLSNAAVSASEEVTMKPSINFTPNFQTDIKWSVENGIESGAFIASGVLSLDLDVAFNFQAAASYNPAPVLLTTRKYTAIYLIGELLVYQETTLKISAEITATAQSKIIASTHSNATETVTIGVKYDPATEQWVPVRDNTQTKSFTAQININGGVQAEVRLIPEIEVKLYKVPSGTLTIEPFINGSIQLAQITTDPVLLRSLFPHVLEPTQFDFNLGVESNVSLSLNTLFRKFTLLPKTSIGSTTIPLFNLPTLQLQGLDGSSIKVGEAQALTLNVTNGINDNFNPGSIQWEAISDDSKELASFTNQSCSPNPAGFTCKASFTAQTAGNFNVLASGYGTLGEVARQYSIEKIAIGCEIGKPGPAGGIIFYCDDTGDHGLEAAPEDQAESTWGCWDWDGSSFPGTSVGSTATAIGTGAANTAAIIGRCGTGGTGGGAGYNQYGLGTASNAAATAAAYTLNGYSDWYLPSRDELNQLYLNQGVVGGFAYNGYWSSTEYDNYYAWVQFFSFGGQYSLNKNYTLGVRAVRAF